jgi:hypothetical protein
MRKAKPVNEIQQWYIGDILGKRHTIYLSLYMILFCVVDLVTLSESTGQLEDTWCKWLLGTLFKFEQILIFLESR